MPTKQLTRQEVEGVIERLVDKTLSFGCLLEDKKTGLLSRFVRTTNGGEVSIVGNVTGIFSPITFSDEFILRGHPIYIGNVLDKISKGEWNRTECNHDIGITLEKVMMLWEPLVFSKSLQEIIEASGWEEVECIDSECPCGVFPLRNNNCPYKAIIKSPETNALFSFLLQIGL